MLDELQKNKIKKLHKEHVPVREIAKEIRCHRATVYRTLNNKSTKSSKKPVGRSRILS